VKVAVLDYGFDGVGGGRNYLPENSVVVEHYDPAFVRRFDLGDPDYRKGFEPANRHGRVMAQIVWAVTGSLPGGPKFYLLNANGPTMLRRAVRYAIEQRVDVILFSGSFEGGGGGDGRGPIDRTVSEALAAGILWVNAAGNYGGRVYNGPVRVLPDGFLRLRDGSDVAALRFRNRVDENTVSITLTWNDYRDQEDAGTDKDLDLYVEDWSGRRVGSGAKVQVSGPRSPGSNETRNPRERVVLPNLPAGPDVPSDPDYCYRIRVRAKRGHFTASDRVRILVTATRDAYLTPRGDAPREAVEFPDASGWGELYPPADHPLVLTVGDSDPSSSVGPTVDRRVKPDVIVEDSRAFFTDGLVSDGSSNAAAYVAGAVAVLKAAAPGLRPSHLLRIARQGPAVPAPSVGSRSPRQATSSPPGFHFWKTPSRSGLAEALGDGR
ncbi:MAG: S8 family serine peptidase, partial [Planctomycetia bacterium]|nr:S8 family serine peptidase [Planctomycetia bacterium]